MVKDFDIRDRADICEMVNSILRSKGIAELKIERDDTPVVVEIKRTKRIPPKA